MTEKSEVNDIDKKEEVSQNKEDEELAALLDSALEDFNTTNENKSTIQPNQVSTSDPKKPDPPSTLWNEEFLQQNTSKVQQYVQNLISPGSDMNLIAEQLGENIQRLVEAASQTAGFDASPDTEFSSIIAQTLKNLSENTENIQVTEDELKNLMGTFANLSDSNADSNGFLSLMHKMMQDLLSKDILYPALSNIVEKYPQWLEDNKSKLSSNDFERYTEQLKLMKDVCAELDKESSDDSEEVKNSRFDKILLLMQKVQDCGQPPTELAGDFNPMLQLDEFGNPQLPANFPNQCSLM